LKSSGQCSCSLPLLSSSKEKVVDAIVVDVDVGEGGVGWDGSGCGWKGKDERGEV
jgi:hypothetical protein